MSVPSWWPFVLLSLAAWRTWRILAEDSILDAPRAWLLRLGDWQPGDPIHTIPSNYRASWGNFIRCPACFGFWIGLAWWIAWQIWPHGTEVAAAPLAISAAVIFAKGLDPVD